MAQISLCGKLQADTEMKATAAKFRKMCSGKTHEATKASPDKILGVNLLDGQWGNEGSVICWNYIFIVYALALSACLCVKINEKSSFAKEIVQTLDNKNYSTTFKVIGGDLMGHYKSFKFHYQATPKGGRTVVRSTLEYEKVNENVPDPNKMLDLVVSVIKDIDAHLTKA